VRNTIQDEGGIGTEREKSHLSIKDVLLAIALSILITCAAFFFSRFASLREEGRDTGNTHVQTTGFTLIEMSIVLVIIGLIVGGVLAGRELVRSAELKSVITDINSFTSAIHTFRDKYSAIPGDMPNATTYWGTDASCPNTPANSVPKKATCNGNGDGTIGPWPTAQTYEIPRTWQHLANAGLIAGSYTGVSAPAGGVIPGLNGPASRISGAGYSIEYNANFGLTEFMPIQAHVIYFGATVVGDNTEGPAISPADAYAIDSKMDDGMPATGVVMSLGTLYDPNCYTAAAYPNEKYDLTKNGPQCALMFRMPF
jgi:prepilin-type N-terminal cleavage/methylation domain-containing protein